MLEGPVVVDAFRLCGITHVVWVPDTELGRWDDALSQAPGLSLIRVCREGEAIAVAGGLLLGGKWPIVLMQCTGFFEAGDALRNFVHDLKLPLFFIIGARGFLAHQPGVTADTCPLFVEPILKAWQLPYLLFDPRLQGPTFLVRSYCMARDEGRAGALLMVE